MSLISMKKRIESFSLITMKICRVGLVVMNEKPQWRSNMLWQTYILGKGEQLFPIFGECIGRVYMNLDPHASF
jgi:hypothetical protein